MREERNRHLSDFLQPLLDQAVREGVFPAAALGISVFSELGRQRFFFAAGATTDESAGGAASVESTSYFDLASLTKPLATTLAVMQLCAAGLVRLKDPLSKLLETETASPKNRITLRHLLCHASGLAAHRPYFEKLAGLPEEQRKDAVMGWILAEPLTYRTGEKAVYSDLGFMLLGFMVEIKSGIPLDSFVEGRVMRPFGLANNIFFNRLSGTKKPGLYIPTEECPLRRKRLYGEVHDDNAYCLDGVAGHAGLFGNVEAVLTHTELLLDLWRGRKESTLFDRQWMRRFLSRQQDIPESTWALGFDTPSQSGSSSGSYFSASSVGHLGFTGTSFWIDPERDLVVALLTNRVYAGRENTRIRQFRPLLHDRIVECLGLR